MSHSVDFKTVSTVGPESTLAGTIRGSYFAFTNEY
jgi:hypothetical protein